MKLIRSVVAAPMAVSFVLLVTACGSSSDEGSPGATGSSGTSGIVKVGYTSEGGLQEPLYWALEKGLFDQAGINVKDVKINSSSNLVPAIESDSVDIGTGDGAAVCSAILSGKDIKIVGSNLSTFALEIWGEKSLSDMTGLKGKTVAVTGTGSTSFFAFQAALKANNMTKDDVKLAVVKSLPATVAAVESGAVAATPVVPPHGVTLEPKGFKMLYDTSALPHVSTAVAIKPAYLSAHRDQVAAFLSAMQESIKQIEMPENKDELAKIVAKRSEVSESEAAYTVDYFKGLWNGSMKVEPNVWDSTCQESLAITKPAPGANPAAALDMSVLAGIK